MFSNASFCLKDFQISYLEAPCDYEVLRTFIDYKSSETRK